MTSGPVLSFSENGGLAKGLQGIGLSLAASEGAASSAVAVASDDPELIASAIASLARERGPSVILIGSTKVGREVSGRLAVKLRLGCLTGVRNLRAEGGALTGERSVYGGRFVAKVSAALPCIALVDSVVSVREGEVPASQPPEETIPLDGLPRGGGKTRRIRSLPKPKPTIDLRSARVVVSAGRGIRTMDDLAMIEGLAAAMGGAVACSRPLAADLGWMGEDRHVGLTGISVHPDLYLAVGISGQLQHVIGIKDSKIVAAINRDAQAPIFQVSDYGIVGDLYAVVPALVEALKKPAL